MRFLLCWLFVLAVPSYAADRIRLTSDVVIAVDPVAGSDANCGPASPCRTLQHAWDVLADEYDLAGRFKATIRVVGPRVLHNDGIQTAKCVPGMRDASAVTVDGNGSVLVRTDGRYAFELGSLLTAEAALCARFRIEGFTLTAQPYGGVACVPNCGGGINSNGGMILVGRGIVFHLTIGGAHLNASGPGANILVVPTYEDGSRGGYAIAGSANVHANAMSTGIVVIQSVTVTCGAGHLAFPEGFAVASRAAGVYASFTLFPGCQNVTGPRYTADMAGLVETTSNQTQTYLPGNAPGTATRFGIYD